MEIHLPRRLDCVTLGRCFTRTHPPHPGILAFSSRELGRSVSSSQEGPEGCLDNVHNQASPHLVATLLPLENQLGPAMRVLDLVQDTRFSSSWHRNHLISVVVLTAVLKGNHDHYRKA